MALFTQYFETPFWGRGFRPFFLLGSLYAALSVLIWGGHYAGYVDPPSFAFSPLFWHAHEMIYGFSMAIVAGFLLTAVANWTGGAPARQVHLGALCGLWVSGRLVMSVDVGFPSWLIYAIDSAFLPALAATLAIPLIRSWNKRNFIFLVLLTILFVCDLGFFLWDSVSFLYGALLVILTMVSLIGGRIIPAFTVAALRRKGLSVTQRDQMPLDIAALVSLLSLMAALFLLGDDHAFVGGIACLSAVIHAVRMRAYHTLKTAHDPMLWILHLGYGWLVIGLLLLGLSAFGVLMTSTALHALTVGAIGSMTIGMMCRVALGHTGRDIIASFMVILAFYSMQFAAIVRVFLPIFFPDVTTISIVFSACLWSGAFLIYAIVFWKILFSPRPDGQAA